MPTEQTTRAPQSPYDQRPGEIRLEVDPGTLPGDAHIRFVGRIRTPWATRRDCPKNPREARERGKTATVEIDAPFRPGLAGLAGFSHVVLLYWMHEGRRDLVVQHPKHLAEPRGVFALRSPARPNPIALSVVRLIAVDEAAGTLTIDAIDCIDGTALVDIKPYLPSVDAVPSAVVP